ncbi:MAG: AAA family ATPase [Acidobacteria bacterium RIFCSPLOWO2_02_FULL_65_29]|nr:MAG: AAA family ATPase [Acidobacteria bacterium RIFCSPLOWO2_02_FULL_65_29]
MTPSPAEIEAQAATFRECFGHLKAEIGRAFVGQQTLVDHLLLCFFCQGHALIEGPPGLGKTLLVRTLADALSLDFSRIQCTPDLMPADVTGTNVLGEGPGGVRQFSFQRGPIFANIVLADELNRATPRTQSAFLEAMQERHVTVFGVTHPLAEPFSVFATQNPIEMEGTYPLPEAQLDRFFFKLLVHTPSVDELAEILTRTTGVESVRPVSRYGAATVRAMADLIKQVKVAEPAMRLVLRLIQATHPDSTDAPPVVKKYVRYGASPRAAQAMTLAAKGLALLAGRYHVASDDVRQVALPALNHRIILGFQAEMEQVSRESVVRGVLEAVSEHEPC